MSIHKMQSCMYIQSKCTWKKFKSKCKVSHTLQLITKLINTDFKKKLTILQNFQYSIFYNHCHHWNRKSRQMTRHCHSIYTLSLLLSYKKPEIVATQSRKFRARQTHHLAHEVLSLYTHAHLTHIIYLHS